MRERIVEGNMEGEKGGGEGARVKGGRKREGGEGDLVNHCGQIHPLS